MPSANARIVAGFERFFSNLPPNGTLVFMTFGFDEMVLAQILEQMAVPSRYRLTVFHDILKHHNPGYLRRFYPQTQTVAVCLRPTATASCPVFHTKLWMVLEAPKTIGRLAVHSMNLTRYHLGGSARTWESFWTCTNLKVKLPGSPLLALLGDPPGSRRVARRPETFVIEEDEGGSITFRRTAESAGTVIRARCEAGALGALISAAAPFVLGKVVSALANGAPLPPIYTGYSENRGALHAKLLVFEKGLVAGSANLTHQAMRIGKTPVNHETVLHLRKTPKGLLPELELFPRFANDAEVPGDDMDIAPADWKTERQLADRGPHRVGLVLRGRSSPSVSLQIDGPLGNVSSITLKSATEGSPRLRLPVAGRRIDPPGQKQCLLAELLFRPPVIVEGLSHSTKPLWCRELDLGELWEVVRRFADPTGSVRLPGMDTGSARPRNAPGTHNVPLFDIREMRDRVLEYAPIKNDWLHWIFRYHPDASEFRAVPLWILELRQLRRHGRHA